MIAIPSDFVALINCTFPDEIRFPWRYQRGKYVLNQQLFYQNGSWRTFTIYFDFDHGYDFHSIFYFGTSDGSPSPEVTRSEFDKLNEFISAEQIIEHTESNEPHILDWLYKRGVIQDIQRDQANLFSDSLSRIWKKWNPQDIISLQKVHIELVSSALVRYFELGIKPPREEEIHPDQRILDSQQKRREGQRQKDRARDRARVKANYAEKNLESNISIYPTIAFPPELALSQCIPSKGGSVDWAPRSLTHIDGMFSFNYDSQIYLVFASFDFSETPYFRFGQWLPRTSLGAWENTIANIHDSKWKYFSLDPNGFNFVMKKLLDDGSIQMGTITDRNTWIQRCSLATQGKVRMLPWTDLCSHHAITNSDIVRW